MNFLNYIFLISILFSCAWNNSEIRQVKRPQTDLVEDFKLDSKLAEKFKEVGLEEKVKEQESKLAENEKSKESKESNKEKKTSEKENLKAEKKTVVKNKPRKQPKKIRIDAKKAVVKIEKEKKKKGYPKGYPEQFKKYNKKYKDIWAKSIPRIFVGEEMEIDVKYFNVTAGKVILRTLENAKIGSRDTFHFRADLKSAPFYAYIYELDDYLESFWDVETLLPLKYTLVQRESGQSVDDLQIFDFQELKTHFFYKRVKKGKTKKEKKEDFIPAYFQDSFAALFFARGLPLEKGDVYEFPIVTRAKVWLVQFKVLGEEVITVGGEKIKAIKIDAETRFPGILKKKGDINFWFSADEYRRILKFEAKVKLGTIYGELARFKKGKRI